MDGTEYGDSYHQRDFDSRGGGGHCQHGTQQEKWKIILRLRMRRMFSRQLLWREEKF